MAVSVGPPRVGMMHEGRRMTQRVEIPLVLDRLLNVSRTVVFVGDSITGQQVDDMIVGLQDNTNTSSAGGRLCRSISPSRIRGPTGADPRLSKHSADGCKTICNATFSAAHMLQLVAFINCGWAGVNAITIRNMSTSFDVAAWTNNMASMKRHWSAHDVLIYNIGAHYDHPPKEGPDRMQQYTQTIAAWASHVQQTFPGLIVWREYSATHFDSFDGSYAALEASGNVSSRSCRPISMGGSLGQRHFNRFAEDRLHSSRIHILTVFNLTLPMWQMHRDAICQAQGHNCGRFCSLCGDCRHFANYEVLREWNVRLVQLVNAVSWPSVIH